jgi:segregation and condensation protein B
MSTELKNIIESLLMVSDIPLGVSKIQGLFEEEAAPTAEEIKDAIAALNDDCAERSVEVQKIGSGYRFQTKQKYAQWIRKLQAGRPPRLSRAQLETLAIIAYRQPVTRGDIEGIRGVAVSSEIMQRLMEREWIKQIGVRDVPGRPSLFGTTPEFLCYFNLESLGDLPPLMEQREFSDIAKDMDIKLPPDVLAALANEEDEMQSDMFQEQEEQDVSEVEQSEEATIDDDGSNTLAVEPADAELDSENTNQDELSEADDYADAIDASELSSEESETIESESLEADVEKFG